jgi:hypothetical protein
MGWHAALLMALLNLGGPLAVADSPPPVEQVLAVFDDSERARLLSGEIVSKPRKEQETNKAALAVTLGLWVPGNLEEVARRLQAISVLQAKQEGASKHTIQGPVKGDGRSAAFSGVRFTETKEINALLAAKPGDEFNLSTEEIGLFQKLAASLKGKPEAERAEAVSATYRRVLENRYLAYTTGGLDAL